MYALNRDCVVLLFNRLTQVFTAVRWWIVRSPDFSQTVSIQIISPPMLWEVAGQKRALAYPFNRESALPLFISRMTGDEYQEI